jgi:hypothetical protein
VAGSDGHAIVVGSSQHLTNGTAIALLPVAGWRLAGSGLSVRIKTTPDPSVHVSGGTADENLAANLGTSDVRAATGIDCLRRREAFDRMG